MGLVFDAERSDVLAKAGEVLDRVIRAVSQPQCSILTEAHAVRARKVALAKGPLKLPVAVEHHHGVVRAVEDVDVVVFVDRYGADLFEDPAVRQLRPVFLQLVPVIAGADRYRHRSSSFVWFFSGGRVYSLSRGFGGSGTPAFCLQA